MAKKTIVVAKTADQARAQATAATATKATAAQAAAQKAAAAQAAAAKAAAAKKAAADKAAASDAQKKKDAAYIASLSKVTSPTSSGLYTYGERINMSGGSTPYNAEQAATGLTAKPEPTPKKDSDPIDPDPLDPPEDPFDTAAANARTDAFALIKLTLQGYGFTDSELNELFAYIEKGLKDPKMGPNQMVLELRTLPVYKARFAGNETRVQKGLNALSEADYKRQEDSYAQYLTAGGVSRLGNRATYAKLIGGAVAPDEVGKRVNMAVDRVVNSDPDIMKMIYKYNPTISQQDLVAYFLDPDATLPELEKKVSMGEIGTAAAQAGMNYDYGRIEGLTKYGINRSQAIKGYGEIGDVLPVSEKLSDIYAESGINYDQTSGESEFFKADSGVKEKRRQLKSLERAQFSGSSGVSGQAGSLNKNTQGAF